MEDSVRDWDFLDSEEDEVLDRFSEGSIYIRNFSFRFKSSSGAILDHFFSQIRCEHHERQQTTAIFNSSIIHSPSITLHIFILNSQYCKLSNGIKQVRKYLGEFYPRSHAKQDFLTQTFYRM